MLEKSDSSRLDEIKKRISYAFLGVLFIIAVQSIVPQATLEGVKMPLMIAAIALGAVTFHLNRDKFDEIEEEGRQEEIEEERRELEFAWRYPRINQVWGVKWVASWMYKEGLWYIGCLFGIIILALILRFNRISTLDYWIDEFYSMITAQTVLDGTFPILPSGAPSHRAIIYFHILAGSIKLFGFNQFAGRILNLIFSALIIYALYLIGKRFFDRSVGVVAAFLFSISPLAINMAREIRMYEMTAFLSLVVIGLGYIIIDKFNKSGNFIKDIFKCKTIIYYSILFIFIELLTLDTHLSTILFLFSIYIYLIYLYLIRKYTQYKLFILIGPIILPFVIIFSYKSYNLIEGFFYLLKTGLGLDRSTWALTYAPLDWHILNLINNSGLISIVYIGLFCSILLTIYSIHIREKQIFLILMILIPLIPISIQRLNVDRYSYFLLPIFILYITSGLVMLFRLISVTILRMKYFNIILIITLIGLTMSNIQIGYSASNNPPWAKTVNFEEASEIIKEHSNSNTTVIYNFMAAPIEAYGVKANYFFVEMQMEYFNEYNGSHMLLGTKYLKLDEFEEYIKKNSNIIVAIRPWPSDITDTTYAFLNQNMKKIDNINTKIIIYHKE